MKRVLLPLLLITATLISCEKETEPKELTHSSETKANEEALVLKPIKRNSFSTCRQSGKRVLLLNSLYVQNGEVQLCISKEDATFLGITEEEYDRFEKSITKSNGRR